MLRAGGRILKTRSKRRNEKRRKGEKIGERRRGAGTKRVEVPAVQTPSSAEFQGVEAPAVQTPPLVEFQTRRWRCQILR